MDIYSPSIADIVNMRPDEPSPLMTKQGLMPTTGDSFQLNFRLMKRGSIQKNAKEENGEVSVERLLEDKRTLFRHIAKVEIKMRAKEHEIRKLKQNIQEHEDEVGPLRQQNKLLKLQMRNQPKMLVLSPEREYGHTRSSVQKGTPTGSASTSALNSPRERSLSARHLAEEQQLRSRVKELEARNAELQAACAKLQASAGAVGDNSSSSSSSSPSSSSQKKPAALSKETVAAATKPLESKIVDLENRLSVEERMKKDAIKKNLAYKAQIDTMEKKMQEMERKHQDDLDRYVEQIRLLVGGGEQDAAPDT
jgi:hypothetical protein